MSDVCSSDLLMTESKHSAQSGGHGCCGSHGGQDEGTPLGLVVDPVCGMTVDPQKTAHHATHANHEYHFCSAGCRAKFVGDPEHYLIPAADRMVDAPPGTIWTRSEEHTSELQSLMRISYAVFCLKKKKQAADRSHRVTLNPHDRCLHRHVKEHNSSRTDKRIQK